MADVKPLINDAGKIRPMHAGETLPAGNGGTGGTSGATTPAEVLLDTVSPSATGVVTFNSISGAYRDLRVVVRGRGTTSATAVAINLTLNNDTGSNYDTIGVNSNGSVLVQYTTAADVNIAIGNLPAANAPSGAASAAEYRIYNYADTNLHKSVSVLGGTKTGSAASNLFPRTGWGFYRSTSAITRIDLTLAAGNFATGSVVSLYGIL